MKPFHHAWRPGLLLALLLLTTLSWGTSLQAQAPAAGPGATATQASSAQPEGARSSDRTGTFICLVFVVMYAWTRFQTPPTKRSSTTITRYYTAAFAYTLWAVALYFSLVLVPDVLLKARLLGAEKLADLLALVGLPYAVLVTLSLTTLLSHIPPLALLDSRIRTTLEHMAAIPYEARMLADQLSGSDSPGGEVSFQVPEAIRRKVRGIMLSESFTDPDVVFDTGPRLNRMWTKIETLKLHLDEWKTNRRYSSFCETYRKQLTGTMDLYRDLNARVRQCLRFLDAKPSDDGYSGRYESEIERQVQKLLEEFYACISAGVLQCEFRLEDRRHRLATLGFSFSSPLHTSPVLMFHRFAALFSGLASLILVVYTVRWLATAEDRSYPEIFSRSLFVSLTYIVAIIWAVLPREKGWTIAQRTSEEVRPVLFYLAAGALTVISNLALSIGWALVKEWANWERFGPGYQKSARFFLLGLITAFTTAFLIDTGPGSPLRRFGRWSEGVIQAVATAGAASVVVLLQGWSLKDRSDVIVTAIIVGFALGACVPTWFRVAPRVRPELGPAALETVPLRLEAQGR